MDVSSTSKPITARSFKVNETAVSETNGKHYCFYQSWRGPFQLDFNALCKSENQQPNQRFPIVEKFSPDVQRLLITDAFHARLYDLDARRMMWETMLPWSAKYVVADSFAHPIVVFSKDGSRAAVVIEYRVLVLDTATGAVVIAFEEEYHQLFSNAQFSADNATVLLTQPSHIVFLDVKTGAIRKLPLDVDVDSPRSRLVDGAEKTLAVYNTSRGVMLIDTETGALKKDPWRDENFRFEYFSDDGRYFFTVHATSIDKATGRREVRYDSIVSFDCVTQQKVATFEISKSMNAFSYIFEMSPKTSIVGDQLAVTNSNGTAMVGRINSNHLSNLMKVRPIPFLPILPKEREVYAISCLVMPSFAKHQFSSSGERLYVEVSPSYGRQGDGLTRDFIYRRNHPEEWWGVLCTFECVFAAACCVLLIWSLVRDWRELPR